MPRHRLHNLHAARKGRQVYTNNRQIADKLNTYMQSYPVDFVLTDDTSFALSETQLVDVVLRLEEIKRDPTGQRLLAYLKEAK